MKTLVLIMLLCIANMFGHAQEKKGIDITVEINNIKNNKGFILLGLHNEETFMNNSKPPFQRFKSKIVNRKVKMIFKNVSEGNFAILVLHDENSNNQMDFEVNGMPKEDYGISNNEMSYGPPIFEDAKFKVAHENLNINIRL